jgi:hypothetical protein
MRVQAYVFIGKRMNLKQSAPSLSSESLMQLF